MSTKELCLRSHESHLFWRRKEQCIRIGGCLQRAQLELSVRWIRQEGFSTYCIYRLYSPSSTTLAAPTASMCPRSPYLFAVKVLILKKAGMLSKGTSDQEVLRLEVSRTWMQTRAAGPLRPRSAVCWVESPEENNKSTVREGANTCLRLDKQEDGNGSTHSKNHP